MPTADLTKVLAARIRAARRATETANGKRMSQQALADRIGVHVITVSQWERGNASPSIANLAAVAEATGKPVAYFMGDDDEEEDDLALRRLAHQLVDLGQDTMAIDLLERVRSMKNRRETLV